LAIPIPKLTWMSLLETPLTVWDVEQAQR